MTAAAEVMQEAEQRAAGIVRRHYHSTYPPSTVVFTRSSELEDILSALEVPYRQTETLIMVELQDLAEKLPTLSEWLEGEKQKSEQRLLKLKTSTRSKPSSSDSSGENARGHTLGGRVLYNTSSTTTLFDNIRNRDDFRELVSRQQRRVTTSVKVDPELWARFKTVVLSQGLSLSEVIEALIRMYLEEWERGSTK